MINYIDEHKDDTFDSVHRALTTMVQQDPDQAERHIRGILKDLYINQGLDWTGRGAICNAGLEASIAAHECILAEMNRHHTSTKGERNHERKT